MTATSNHKKIEIGKETYFVEKFWEKGMVVSLWRYGRYINGRAVILKSHLRSRPNIKRMFS